MKKKKLSENKVIFFSLRNIFYFYSVFIIINYKIVILSSPLSNQSNFKPSAYDSMLRPFNPNSVYIINSLSIMLIGLVLV